MVFIFYSPPPHPWYIGDYTQNNNIYITPFFLLTKFYDWLPLLIENIRGRRETAKRKKQEETFQHNLFPNGSIERVSLITNIRCVANKQDTHTKKKSWETKMTI